MLDTIPHFFTYFISSAHNEREAYVHFTEEIRFRKKVNILPKVTPFKKWVELRYEPCSGTKACAPATCQIQPSSPALPLRQEHMAVCWRYVAPRGEHGMLSLNIYLAQKFERKNIFKVNLKI